MLGTAPDPVSNVRTTLITERSVNIQWDIPTYSGGGIISYSYYINSEDCEDSTLY